jgi:hypothetical protein
VRNGTVKSKSKQTRRVISSQSIGVRPYVDDLREMTRLCDNGKKETVTELARTLINEALRARRIREVSGVEDAPALVKIEPQAVAEAINPLREEMREVIKLIAGLAASARSPAGELAVVDGGAQQVTDLVQQVQTILTGVKQQEAQATQVMQALYTLLVQVLGYSMMTERETRRLLEGDLNARGQSPESVKDLLAQLEERSHQETDEIVFKVLREHRLAE